MRHVEGTILAVLSGYEFVALVHEALRPESGRVPPITHLVRPLPPPVKAPLVGAAAVWLVAHMGPWRRRP